MALDPGDPATLIQRFIGLVNGRSAGESIAFMHASGLTMPQIVVLHLLRRAANTVSELARQLRMSLPATSQLVDRLVESGMVDRTESATDRRVRTLSLRPAGDRFLDRLGTLRHRDLDGTLGALQQRTRTRLAAAVGEALRELEQGLDAAAERPDRALAGPRAPRRRHP
jgi:DNA-binding MarR family transcriptional regulator